MQVESSVWIESSRHQKPVVYCLRTDWRQFSIDETRTLSKRVTVHTVAPSLCRKWKLQSTAAEGRSMSAIKLRVMCSIFRLSFYSIDSMHKSRSHHQRTRATQATFIYDVYRLCSGRCRTDGKHNWPHRNGWCCEVRKSQETLERIQRSWCVRWSTAVHSFGDCGLCEQFFYEWTFMAAALMSSSMVYARV